MSKDPSTLQLLEVGAGIRDRYKEQAQKCDQKFLYRAMKLCNDCDLNYRASKNKRLLVELTLIQCAQLTLPDADDASGGRGPKKILKPLLRSKRLPQPPRSHSLRLKLPLHRPQQPPFLNHRVQVQPAV